MRRLTFVSVGILLLAAFPVWAQISTSDMTSEWSSKSWKIDASGDLIPLPDSANDIGESGAEVDNLYADSLWLGGVEKTSWGSVVSPWTDAVGYVNPTDAGNYVRVYDAGYLRLGDATTAGDYYVLFTGDSDAWYAGQYDSTNDYVIGYGSTVGTDIRLAITDDANTTTVTIGDNADSYDKALIFDGNAYDFYMAYDDSADDLLIGLGAAVGTTPAISITNGLVITTYAGITMTGTAPVLTVGDAGEEDTTLLFDGNAQDFYIALDDSADDLLIGLGNAVGTTPAISIDETLAVSMAAGLTLVGDIAVNGDDITCDGDMVLDPAGNDLDIDAADVWIDGGKLLSLNGSNEDVYLAFSTNLNLISTADILLDPAGGDIDVDAADVQLDAGKKLSLNGATETDTVYSSTDLQIAAAADVVITPTGGQVDFNAADIGVDAGKYIGLQGIANMNEAALIYTAPNIELWVDGKNTVSVGAASSTDLIFEGSTADGNETTLVVTNPTADRTVTLANAAGTIALGEAAYRIYADNSAALVGGALTETFPTAFSAAPAIMAIANQATGAYMYTTAISTTAVTFASSEAGGATTAFTYTAIGTP